MASPTYFTAGVSGDPTNASNWSNGLPVDTGTFIVPASTGVKMTGGDLSSVDAALGIIEKGYRFDIGGSGDRFRIACGKIVHAGDGKLWLNAEHASADIDKLVLQGTGGADVDDDGTAQILDILVESGRLDYNCGGGSDRVEVIGSNSRFEAISGAGTIALYTQTAGVGNNDGVTMTRAELLGSALFTMLRDNNGTIGSEGILVGGSARCRYNSSVTLPLARVYGGLLDFTKNPYAITVTELVSRKPGMVNKGLGQVTFGAASSIGDGTVVGGVADV